MSPCTIVAIVTPPAQSAIGILRLSGKHTLGILNKRCRLKRKRKNDEDALPIVTQNPHSPKKEEIVHAKALSNSLGKTVTEKEKLHNKDGFSTYSGDSFATDKKALSFAHYPRQLLYCSFVAKDETSVIDEGLAVFYESPHSYTGEAAAELFLHGNPLLLRKMLTSILSTGLARLAEAGEFTKRAYLNRKIDLSQAEAVNQIIQARNEWELVAARKNLFGSLENRELGRLTLRLRSKLLHLKAEVEAEIDFPSESLTLNAKKQGQEWIQFTTQVVGEIDDLLKRAMETERIRSVSQVAIVGAPNAGKSSLLNAILGWDRAIVSTQAGTTRDYISEEIQLAGAAVRFVDTAGLRAAKNLLEQEGIAMARKIIQQSQLVLHVIDGARPPYTLEQEPLQKAAQILTVLNKCDQEQAKRHTSYLESPLCISCLSGEGLETLRKRICDILFGTLDMQNILLLETRQQYHLQAISKTLQKCLQLWQQQAPAEIVALELDFCLEQVGAITRPVDNEEVLGRIFSMFCIGK